MLEFKLLFWLGTKHIIADYYMQYPWMFRHKGKYGHPGGIAHSLWHGILTFVVLINFVDIVLAFSLAFLDFVLHYHIDYLKSKAWKNYNLTPSDQKYWIIHGTDQFAHMMTYFLIVHLIGSLYV